MSDDEPVWVSKFRTAILELENAIQEFDESDPPLEEACQALVMLNVAKGEVGMVYDGLTRIVSEIMGDDPEVSLGNNAKIEKKWSSTRTGWQHKDLCEAVAKRIVDSSVDMDSGEVLASPKEMISKVLDYLQPSYWRIKELQKLGLNPDQYCEVGETKTSIIVRKGTNK
jgi:hypothetical protein